MDSPLFCSSCRRLYPADGLSFFELLGVDAAYDIDPREVRGKYLELVRTIHPDHLTPEGSEAEHLSMRVSARMNQAFRVLLDPVLRAEYLLELAGGKSAADDRQVPRDVLAKALTLREELEEAKAEADEKGLERVRREIQSRFDAALQAAAELARKLPGTEQTRADLRGELNAIRYYRKIREQL